MSCFIYTICIVLMFAYQGLTRSIDSSINTDISPAIPILRNVSISSSRNRFAYRRHNNFMGSHCPPKFLYSSVNNTCHEVYRQGPCQQGYYIYQSANETAPRCIENPCIIDGLVQFNGMCYPLGSWKPCSDGPLLVNPMSLRIQCRRRTVAFSASIAEAPRIPTQPPCPPGTVRIKPGAGCKIPI